MNSDKLCKLVLSGLIHEGLTKTHQAEAPKTSSNAKAAFFCVSSSSSAKQPYYHLKKKYQLTPQQKS